LSNKLTVPAIVIVAYNREDSLARMLKSVSNACYNDYPPINLIISIDGGGKEEVKKLAEEFEWQYGIKKIIVNEINKGLRKHVLSCGDLADEYESVIILEDDCYVSRDFYNYSFQAINFYKEDEHIAGISLYAYQFIENAPYPFYPLDEGYNNYFMQVPSSWGQAFTKSQWDKFKSFYDSKPCIDKTDRLPDNVKSWKESSWKKYFYKYLVDSNLFFVYPVNSLTTNFGDIGEHYDIKTNLFQVPLTIKRPGYQYSFVAFEKSWNKYDAYFEVLPEFLNLSNHTNSSETGLDLFGTKQLGLFDYKYIYSIKDCINPIQSFGIDLKPLLQNLVNETPGNCIHYGLIEDFTIVSQQTGDLLMQFADNNSYEYAYQTGITSGRIAGIKFVKNSKVYKAGVFLLSPLLLLKGIFSKFKK
jgi:hypothetical protein